MNAEEFFARKVDGLQAELARLQAEVEGLRVGQAEALRCIGIWRTGCTCAPADRPEECPECTAGLVKAIEKVLRKDGASLIEVMRVTSLAAIGDTDLEIARTLNRYMFKRGVKIEPNVVYTVLLRREPDTAIAAPEPTFSDWGVKNPSPDSGVTKFHQPKAD